jgi:hypothetical protein
MVGSGQLKIKGKKAQVQITLSPELLEKARKYGLNVSKIAENALKSYIERLEGNKTETSGGGSLFGEAFSSALVKMVLRPGFGPGSPARKAGILNRAILPELCRPDASS